MRSSFTNYDVKNFVESIFKENDEKITIIDESGAQETAKLLNYLNIELYAWKDRVVTAEETQTAVSPYGAWVESLNLSLNKAYALVEIVDETVTPSQDIDSALLTGKVSFVIQSNKVSNLDYFITKIRSKYLGNPQIIQNAYGDKLTGFINFGRLFYDSEPFDSQIGEIMQVSANFTISYLTEALTYYDTPMWLSLNASHTVESDYMEVPYIKGTWQNIFTGQPCTNQVIPTRTGIINSSVTKAVTIAYYDFNKELTLALNEIFWETGANYIGEDNGGTVSYTQVNTQEVNIPVWVKVLSNGKYYLYKMVLSNMQKDFTNGDFNISSITLKYFGKK